MSRKHVFWIFVVLLFLGGCVSQAVRTPEHKPPETPTFEDGFRRIGRNECGVPMFNKIPFLNRYFMNVAIGTDGFIWDPRFPFDTAMSASAVVSDDGNWLLTGRNQDGSISVFNLQEPSDHQLDLVPSKNDRPPLKHEYYDSAMSETSYELALLESAGTQIVWLAFTPDSSAFLACRLRVEKDYPNTPAVETLELFERSTGNLLRTFPIEPNFQSGAVFPDGETFFCVGKTSLESWNLRSGEKTASVALPELETDEVVQIRCWANLIFVVFRSGKVGIHDSVSLTPTASIPCQFGPSLIDISPDGGTLLVASSAFDETYSHGDIPASVKPADVHNSVLRLYDTNSWVMVREIRPKYPHRFGFASIRFSSDGNRLIARGIERIEKPKIRDIETTIKTFLAQYELDSEEATWTPLEYETLPLHPEGKRLLDGRAHSGRFFSPFVEKMGIDYTR